MQEAHETGPKTAMEVAMMCKDSDTVLCFAANGKMKASGPWYCDTVMGWMISPPRSRFKAEREGDTVKVKRIGPEEGEET